MSDINKIIYEFYQQPMMMVPVPMPMQQQQQQQQQQQPIQQPQMQQTPVQKQHRSNQPAKSLAGVNVTTPRKTPQPQDIIRRPQVQVVRQASRAPQTQQTKTPTSNALDSARNAKSMDDSNDKDKSNNK